VIKGLQGVGAKKANEVLAHFGTVGKAFAASKAEWMAVPGLGKGIVEKVFAVLHE